MDLPIRKSIETEDSFAVARCEMCFFEPTCLLQLIAPIDTVQTLQTVLGTSKAFDTRRLEERQVQEVDEHFKQQDYVLKHDRTIIEFVEVTEVEKDRLVSLHTTSGFGIRPRFCYLDRAVGVFSDQWPDWFAYLSGHHKLPFPRHYFLYGDMANPSVLADTLGYSTSVIDARVRRAHIEGYVKAEILAKHGIPTHEQVGLVCASKLEVKNLDTVTWGTAFEVQAVDEEDMLAVCFGGFFEVITVSVSRYDDNDANATAHTIEGYTFALFDREDALDENN